jgi:hypothetical protein
MFTSYFAGGFQLASIVTYGLTYLDVATLTFYIVFFYKAIWNNLEFKIPISPVSFFISLFMLAVTLSSFRLFLNMPADQISQYLKTSIHLLFLVLFAYISLSYKIPDKWLNSVVKLWLVLSLFINIFGIYQIFARAFDLPLAWLDYNNVSMMRRNSSDEDMVGQLSISFGNFFRATSVFSEPSALATFNAYILTFIIIPYIQKAKQFINNKALNISIFIFAIIGEFLCFSLTGLVAIGFVALGVFIFESLKTKRIMSYILLGSFLILIPVDLVVESYTETSVLELFGKRVSGILNSGDKLNETTDGESFYTRASTIDKSLDIWEKSPVFGVGIGLTQYNNTENMSFSDFSFTTVLCETGVLGLFAFTGIFIAMMAGGIKLIKHSKSDPDLNEDQRRMYGLTFYIALILFEINFVSGNNVISPNFWLPIVLVLSPLYNFYVDREKTIKFKILNSAPAQKYLSGN